MAQRVELPLFLHDRATDGELLAALEESGVRRGVVHSFTGTAEEAAAIVALSPELFVGINGCGLKTVESITAVATVPLERVLLETDAPWCGVRPTHASFKHVTSTWPEVAKPEKHVPSDGRTVKQRSEPCHVRHVAEVVAALHSVSVHEVASVTTSNAETLFSFSK
jgi:TatD DNase family protein